MPNVSKAQDMRPSLSDVMDFLNTGYEQDKDNINTAIAAESANRKNADDVLQQHIEAETSRATLAEQDESANRKNADDVLQQHIEAETSRATLAEQDITNHLETAEEELEGKITAETARATQAENNITGAVIPALAGTGLAYDSSTGKLNGVQADDITLGMVKLTHDVSHQDEQEYAITADGVAAYAPSKPETINQPESVEFTNVLSGVTLTVLNPTRIGGIIAMGVRIVTDAQTTVSAATRIANCPTGLFKGIANAIASDGSAVMQADAVGISCNKSIEPSKTLYFQIIGFYNGGN